jgi:hypothetical protein
MVTKITVAIGITHVGPNVITEVPELNALEMPLVTNS